MMASKRKLVPALTASSVKTTLWNGSIGVIPASTRKVAVAESSATPTAIAPNSRDAIGIGAAAAAGSTGATCSTVVMSRIAGNQELQSLKGDDLGPRPAVPSDAFIQQCCPIATIRGRNILPQPYRLEGSGVSAEASSGAGAINLDFEVADFAAERIAGDAQESGGADLVAAGCRQSRRQQRPFDLAQNAVIEARRRQAVVK